MVDDRGTDSVLDDREIIYGYNESGLRTYKVTRHREASTNADGSTEYITVTDVTTTYEWDETTLIRETVTYNETDTTYDIWYFYDGAGNVAGYEYSYINELNQKTSIRIYYEKDLQGNVIGLLDSRGAEVATYSYDAWGNITNSSFLEGYDTAYNLNHITYRSYYRDEESGFYYLQSRYYDPEVCRFINADDVSYLGASGTVWGYNLFSYCVVKIVASIANICLRVIGDKQPDSYSAFHSLSTHNASEFNRKNPDIENVYYQSYSFVMKHIYSDILLWFPSLVVKIVEGQNDGLLTPESTKWGNYRGIYKSVSGRGISHCDEVDLRRKPFTHKESGNQNEIVDMKEFYLEVARELERKGF